MKQGSGDQLITDIFKAIDEAAHGRNSEITIALSARADDKDLKTIKIIICGEDSVVMREPVFSDPKDLSDEN